MFRSNTVITMRLIAMVLLLSLTAIFSSCQTSLKGHEIVGIWEHAGSRIEFTDKGTFKKGNETYPFSVNENKITIDNNGEAMEVEYSINPNGTLTMNGLIYYPVSQ